MLLTFSKNRAIARHKRQIAEISNPDIDAHSMCHPYPCSVGGSTLTEPMDEVLVYSVGEENKVNKE